MCSGRKKFTYKRIAVKMGIMIVWLLSLHRTSWMPVIRIIDTPCELESFVE